MMLPTNRANMNYRSKRGTAHEDERATLHKEDGTCVPSRFCVSAYRQRPDPTRRDPASTAGLSVLLFAECDRRIGKGISDAQHRRRGEVMARPRKDRIDGQPILIAGIRIPEGRREANPIIVDSLAE